ncbi:MAG TPA: YbaB/EbfC family nucleoid-associated protein [Actinophytocola sp.]|uniref:YbaB/EbfC family nucleoid-associated protein n=1 Tax=Actinophytocola sp. TaxID=1872138 RepID=UPI002DB83463|nr:YbaB/EbfC family nucleoid-associated protein [Actinophytocola sp.]HEU5472181.1 YbaB/EbfC family nucleoid-associated protein [Actinophytocola sp.]
MVDSVSEAMRMVDDWERDATEKAARFQRMAEQVEQVTITESVANGAVSVTVGSNGLPTNVAMSDGVRSMEPDEIAANVMAAMRKAQSRYPQRLAEILAETVGTEDPAARHILAKAEESFPSVPDEPAEPAGRPLGTPGRMNIGGVEEDEEPPPHPVKPPRRAPTDGGDEDFGDGSIYR